MYLLCHLSLSLVANLLFADSFKKIQQSSFSDLKKYLLILFLIFCFHKTNCTPQILLTIDFLMTFLGRKSVFLRCWGHDVAWICQFGPSFQCWVFSQSNYYCSFQYICWEISLFYQWETLMVAFVKIMLVPFKYMKHQQTGVILDSLKFYFAILEVQKPRRKMETAELGAGRAGSMVLMLKN